MRQRSSAYHNASDTLGGVAALLQMLRDNGEYARRQSHVEKAVRLRLADLQLLNMLVQALERLVLVILPRDVGAQTAEVVQLLLDLFGWRLHVGPDAANVLLVVHLGSCIADDFDIFWKKLVAVL